MRPEAPAGGFGGTERTTREWHNKGMLIHLTSASLDEDPRLADYTSMTDVHLRKSLEVERGLYMAESTNVIIRALEAGHHPRSLIMAPRWLPDLEPLLERFLGATAVSYTHLDHSDIGSRRNFLPDWLSRMSADHRHRNDRSAR